MTFAVLLQILFGATTLGGWIDIPAQPTQNLGGWIDIPVHENQENS